MLILHPGGLSTATTVLVAQIFLFAFARIACVIIHALGIPWLQTLIRVVSLPCTAYHPYLVAL